MSGSKVGPMRRMVVCDAATDGCLFVVATFWATARIAPTGLHTARTVMMVGLSRTPRGSMVERRDE